RERSVIDDRRPDAPDDHALRRRADIEAEFADRAVIALDASADALEWAVEPLLRGDDQAYPRGRVAAQRADPRLRGSRRQGGERPGRRERKRGEKLPDR